MPAYHGLHATSTSGLRLQERCPLAWKDLGSKPGTPGLTCKRAGPGCHAPHLLHFGHIPDEGFIVHIGEQFAQLVQV